MFRRIDRPEPPTRMTTVRNVISRGTMLVVGVTMLYFGLRGFAGLADMAGGGLPASGTSPRGREAVHAAPILLWLGTIVLILLGGMTVVAAALTRRSMERLFEFWSTPPVTGDSGGSDRFDRRDWWTWDRWWRL